MKRAFDTALSIYVDADTVAKSSSNEYYRYKCANCWEYVHLCAADSECMSTHFRHINGNNNIDCENYLGKSDVVKSNATKHKTIREQLEFYFDYNKKLFTIGIKLNSEEIAKYKNDTVLIKIENSDKDIELARIDDGFFPDEYTYLPINYFSSEYSIKLKNESNWLTYKLFDKGKGEIYPSFFKVLAGYDEDKFKAKLIYSCNTRTIYTNTQYLIIHPTDYFDFDFMNSVKIVKPKFTFKTMHKVFSGIVVVFSEMNSYIIQKLRNWNYELKNNATLTMIWPPSARIDDKMIINSEYAYLISSFSIQANSNTNVDSKCIIQDEIRPNSLLSRIKCNSSIDNVIKVIFSNTDLFIEEKKTLPNVYDQIIATKIKCREYRPDDDYYYLLDSFGYKRLISGVSVLLPKNSIICHYYCGYLDKVIESSETGVTISKGEGLLNDILMYYKRTEPYNYKEYQNLRLSNVAKNYLNNIEKTGLINSAIKRFIKGGLI